MRLAAGVPGLVPVCACQALVWAARQVHLVGSNLQLADEVADGVCGFKLAMATLRRMILAVEPQLAGAQPRAQRSLTTATAPVTRY
jgi:hypothetical protein